MACIRYGHNAKDPNRKEQQAALRAFATMVCNKLEAFCPGLVEGSKQALCNSPLALGPNAPWQLVSYSLAYVSLQHLDTLDFLMSLIAWTVRQVR